MAEAVSNAEGFGDSEMTDTTVDFTMIGQTIATAGTLTRITLTAPPSVSGFYFTLIDDATGEELFCMETSQTAVPTGTVFPMYGHPFVGNLVLKSIAPGSKFDITTSP